MFCSKGELNVGSEALSEKQTGRVTEARSNALDTNQ
jgi:hypothetical protein